MKIAIWATHAIKNFIEISRIEFSRNQVNLYMYHEIQYHSVNPKPYLDYTKSSQEKIAFRKCKLRMLFSGGYLFLSEPTQLCSPLIYGGAMTQLLDSKNHLKWKLPETRCSIQTEVQKCSSSIYLRLNRSPDKGCFSELSTYRLARIDCSFCDQRWPCDVKVTCEMYLLRFLMVIWWILKRVFTLHLHNWLNSLSSFLVPWRYDHLHSR